MDDKIGADRTSVDEVRANVEKFHGEVARPTNLPDLLSMLAMAFVTVVIATELSKILPNVGDIIKGFTRVVLIVTTTGLHDPDLGHLLGDDGSNGVNHQKEA